MAKFIVNFLDRPDMVIDASCWELINGTTLHFFNLGKGQSKQTTHVFGPNTGWESIERKED